MRITESTIVETIGNGITMTTRIVRNIGRQRKRALTTVTYIVNEGEREVWRTEVPIHGWNWRDRRYAATEQERLAYSLKA